MIGYGSMHLMGLVDTVDAEDLMGLVHLVDVGDFDGLKNCEVLVAVVQLVYSILIDVIGWFGVGVTGVDLIVQVDCVDCLENSCSDVYGD